VGAYNYFHKMKKEECEKVLQIIVEDGTPVSHLSGSSGNFR
jgi:hypothetical protein